VTSFPASKALPMTTIDQKAPGKMAVNPNMLKYAATPAKLKAEPKTKRGNIINKYYTY